MGDPDLRNRMHAVTQHDALDSAIERDGSDNGVSVGQHALRFVPDLFIGAGEAAWDMAKGIGTLIFHPIRTAKGIWTLATKLVSEPGTTLRAIGAALVDPYITAVKTGHPGRAIGRGIVEIGSLFVQPGDVVNVARSGSAFAQATVAGLKSGETVSQTLAAAAKAAQYSMKATGAARDAQILAKLGHASDAMVMAEYASDALLVSNLAKGGKFGAMNAAVKALDVSRSVLIAGKPVALGEFLARTSNVLGLRRFSVVSGHLSKDLYTIASEAEKAQTAVRLSEKILAAGARNPNLLQKIGRLATRNPQIFAPLTPALGKIPDVLGKIDSLPKDLPTREGLTPEAAREIAFKYNLESSVANIQAFIAEVTTYEGNTIGPDTGSADQIKQLQVLLKNATYEVPITGVWDRATAAAVIDFKRSKDIRQSYRLANGEKAVNEYADDRVINALLGTLEGVDAVATGRIKEAKAAIAPASAKSAPSTPTGTPQVDSAPNFFQ